MKTFNGQVNNLAQLIHWAVERAPDAVYGVDTAHVGMRDALLTAKKLSGQLLAHGFRARSRIAFVGATSEHYLIMWMATQLSGIEVALLNPNLPRDLLHDMLEDLDPLAVALFDDTLMSLLNDVPWPVIDARRAWDGVVDCSSPVVATDGPGSPYAPDTGGIDCTETDIACYVHTSGTSGRPKFCALSHGYFLRLGRFVSDTLGYAANDVVFAPMPMFHINPLGYGVVSAWTAAAGVLGTQKFSVSRFWDIAKATGATSIVLHFAAMKMLMEKTDRSHSDGHRIRSALCVNAEFLERFNVSIGTTAYGSTEAGGLCHMWHVRPGDASPVQEGPLFYGGRARFDVEAKISESGEILVRELAPNTLFSGYLKDGVVVSALDEDRWFHTGDRGRLDAVGGLVFIERMSESLRVNGEFVPIDYVERHLEAAAGIREFAIWGRPHAISGQQVVLWVTDDGFDPARMAEAIQMLPKFMRPGEIVVIERLPRDSGVNKIQRRRLSEEPPVRTLAVTYGPSLADVRIDR